MSMPIFKCEFDYIESIHLYQLYDGFEKLKRKGIIDLKIRPSSSSNNKPILKVIINDRYTVMYDELDGLNWIEDTRENNISYFKNNIEADFYFKRSYNKLLKDNTPSNCEVYPLGLNFYIEPEGKYPPAFQQRLKKKIKNFNKKLSINQNDNLEYYPIKHKNNQILFLTRLWNPDDVKSDQLKAEREKMNLHRINFIKSCRSEFGSNFLGGLVRDKFSLKHSKDLIMPNKLTDKSSFLNAVKSSNICITTTGLHDSIGWKFGEFIANSKAIISEPLAYQLPGNFRVMDNYLPFENEEGLINNIYDLLDNEDKLVVMMKNNFKYYNSYVRSDVRVLNTLLKLPRND
jgi:hypothetical protein